ncbi:MAG: autotransporter domain-containing protein [Thermoguttaceae bacterium]
MKTIARIQLKDSLATLLGLVLAVFVLAETSVFSEWGGNDTTIDTATTLDGPTESQDARKLTVNDYLRIRNGADVLASDETKVNGQITLSNGSTLTSQGLLTINGGTVWVGDSTEAAYLVAEQGIKLETGSLLLDENSSIKTDSITINGGLFTMGDDSQLNSQTVGSSVSISISDVTGTPGVLQVGKDVVFDNHTIFLKNGLASAGGIVALDAMNLTGNSRLEGSGVVWTQNGLFVEDGATLSPGSVDNPYGILEVQGGLIFDSAGTLEIRAGNDASGNIVNSQVLVRDGGTGNAYPNGYVNLNNAQLDLVLGLGVNGSILENPITIINIDESQTIKGKFGAIHLLQDDRLLPFLSATQTMQDSGDFQLDITRTNYFAQFGRTYNQQQTGRLLDSTDITQDKWWNALSNLGSLNDSQLFAFYSGMSGELKADSMTMYRATPWRAALEQIGWNSAGTGFLGNQNRFGANTCARTSVWLTPYHNETQYTSDGNASDYSIASTGFLAGINRQLIPSMSSGIVFGYGRPELSRSGDSVKANDFLIGAQISSRITTKIEMKSFIGFGFQQYEMSRNASVVGNDGLGWKRIGADYDGNTLFGSIELARPFYIDNFITLRPVVAFESEHVWQTATREYGADLYDLEYAKRRNDQVFVRTGLSGEVGATNFSLLGRAFYSRLIGGTAYTDSETRLANGGADFVQFRGIDNSRDFLTVGGGVNLYLGPHKRRTLSGSYDAIISERSTSQTAFLTFTQLF